MILIRTKRDAKKSRSQVSFNAQYGLATSINGNERRFELAFEGHRFIDITRQEGPLLFLGALNPQLKDANFRIFPIPQSAVPGDPDNLGGVNQNPGY